MFPGLRLKAKGGGKGPPYLMELLIGRDDTGKKLIFLGSRNSRALKCSTQGKLCNLPHRLGFDTTGGFVRDHLVLGIERLRPDPKGADRWSDTLILSSLLLRE